MHRQTFDIWARRLVGRNGDLFAVKFTVAWHEAWRYSHPVSGRLNGQKEDVKQRVNVGPHKNAV